MTPPESPETHGPDDHCGIDVRTYSRLLDTAATARHIGVPLGTLKANVTWARQDDGRSPATWFEGPDESLGKALLWDIATAERMRLAREESARTPGH